MPPRVLLEFQCDGGDNPATCLYESQVPETKSLSGRKVLFSDTIAVHDVEVVPTRRKRKLWYNEKDFDAFQAEFEKEDPDAGTREAVAFNHTRRVLLQHRAYKSMDDENVEGLVAISEESSLNARAKARHQALQLEEEVKSLFLPAVSRSFDSFNVNLNTLASVCMNQIKVLVGQDVGHDRPSQQQGYV